MSYSKKLEAIESLEERMRAKKFRLLEKAARSDSPEDMLKAAKIIERQNSALPDNKSFLIDPIQFNANLGYKDKSFSLSYTTLKRMSKAPVINSIIKTRKSQISDYSEPQTDKYSTGFVVRKKKKNGLEQKMDNMDKKIAFYITDFLLNGGKTSSWHRDDFDTFIRKIVEDSLVYDQMTFELIRNRKGDIEYFLATDASTFRYSDSYFNKDYDNEYFKRNGFSNYNDSSFFGKSVNGYFPFYTQIYQNIKINEFYPWELCFGVRNPSTSIFSNGYGCSELEDLINTVTSILWSDEYNRRFFSQGSVPKGVLRVKGANNEAALQQFRQQWQSMISGVMQSWKTPIIESDVEWIDLHVNNKDMEYNLWLEYLIKIACGVYTMDPSEINWDISRSNSGVFEGNPSERLKNSKDKGLYPLLKFIQRKINKYIVEQIHPDFEFVYSGMNGISISEELDMDIKKVSNFVTLNETRQKYDMEPLENGDLPLNSIFMQNQNQQNQLNQQNQSQVDDSEGNENPFDLYAEQSDEDTEKSEYKETLLKAFDNFLKQEDDE